MTSLKKLFHCRSVSVSQFRQISATSCVVLASLRPLASGILSILPGASLLRCCVRYIIFRLIKIFKLIECGVENLLVASKKIYPDVKECLACLGQRVHAPRRPGFGCVPERRNEAGLLELAEGAVDGRRIEIG